MLGFPSMQINHQKGGMPVIKTHRLWVQSSTNALCIPAIEEDTLATAWVEKAVNPWPDRARKEVRIMPPNQKGGRLFRRGRIWWIQYGHRGKNFRESSESKDRNVAQKLLNKRLSEITVGAFGSLATNSIFGSIIYGKPSVWTE